MNHTTFDKKKSFNLFHKTKNAFFLQVNPADTQKKIVWFCNLRISCGTLNKPPDGTIIRVAKTTELVAPSVKLVGSLRMTMVDWLINPVE